MLAYIIFPTPLQCARNGDTRSMQILLGNMGSNVKKKINVQDEDDLTPLHYAARYNQLEVLKLLVENHAGKLFTISTLQ